MPTLLFDADTQTIGRTHPGQKTVPAESELPELRPEILPSQAEAETAASAASDLASSSPCSASAVGAATGESGEAPLPAVQDVGSAIAASPTSDLASSGPCSASPVGAGSGEREDPAPLGLQEDGSAAQWILVPEHSEASEQEAEGSDESASPVAASEETKALKPDADLCAFCFEAVTARLHSWPPPSLGGRWQEEAESLVSGLFVTWKTQSASLRGCMGSLSPVKLEQGLTDFAVTSALEDIRFRPMRINEMCFLTCRVSILHSFEQCNDAYDWKVGVHGVQVSFTRSALGLSTDFEAVFLPEVMVEAGLTHQTAISKLVYKAGYLGPCDKALLKRMTTTRFQSYACEVRYSDLLRCST